MGNPKSLRRGDRGEEVRRLQHNLNEALQGHSPQLVEDGIFGPKTQAAVFCYQREYHLHLRDGVVGPETRGALATRVLIIDGHITRETPPPAQNTQNAAPNTPTSQPATPPSTSDPPAPQGGRWLVQGQPAFLWTPPPLLFHDPNGGSPPGNIVSGGGSVGLVYQTATEGPHWEFNPAFQFVFNSRNQPTDPRYTMQLSGQVAYADPWSRGRFHTALFAQVAVVRNVSPGSWALNGALGGQVSVDIIADRWNVFAQGTLAGQWVLTGDSSGQLLLLPGVTIGSTVQWEFPFFK